MLRRPRIEADYRRSGAVNALVPPFAFLDAQVFLTKGGDIGVALRLDGVDYECLDHDGRDAVARRFERALRVFDQDYIVYQYLLKRDAVQIPHAPCGLPDVDAASRRRLAHLTSDRRGLFEVETYAVVLYTGWTSSAARLMGTRQWMQHPLQGLRERLSASRTLTILDADLARALAALRHKVDTFVAQTQTATQATLLDKSDTFRLLRRLLNYSRETADLGTLAEDRFVDYALAGSSLECHRAHLRLQDTYVRVLTVKQPPRQTFAHMLQPLYELPANVILCTRWRAEEEGQTRRAIQAKRRHHHNRKSSLTNYLGNAPATPGEMLIDDAAVAMVDDLGGCLKEIDLHGRRFGHWSMTAVLYDADQAVLDQQVRECSKAFASLHADVIEERHNLLNAWAATIPGGYTHDLRQMYLLDVNCADLSFVFGLHGGEPTNPHLGQEYLAVLETSHRTPYYLNLHVHDVAHSLVFGQTGSGKSYFVNFLLANLQKYRPHIVIFDLGGSYTSLVRRAGGSAFAMDLERQPFTINPFALPPTRDHLHFLYSFVRVLIESGGQYTLTLQDEQDLFAQIESLYAIGPDQRRLFTLANILRRPLAQHLARWVQGGSYAALFDHVEDTLTTAQMQCFDFEALERYPQLLEPLLYYALHRTTAVIDDPQQADTLKVFVMDEAWRFLRNATIAQYLTRAWKTWRKRQACLLLATQSTDDLRHSALLRVAIESCPTQFFLSNPGLDRELYRELFALNDLELARIASLIPRQELLLKRTGFAKVLTLSVDPEGHQLYTLHRPTTV
jgi:type IV secretion system protein VirB4